MTSLESDPFGLTHRPPAESTGTTLNKEDLGELSRLVLGAHGIQVTGDNETDIATAYHCGVLGISILNEDYYKDDPGVMLDAFRLGLTLGSTQRAS